MESVAARQDRVTVLWTGTGPAADCPFGRQAEALPPRMESESGPDVWRRMRGRPPSAMDRRREPSAPAVAVLLVGDVPPPRHRAAGLVVLLHGDVHHEPVGRRAVPVVLARLENDAVAGPDLGDGAALALAAPDALGDENRLAVRMGVPCGARAGGE